MSSSSHASLLRKALTEQTFLPFERIRTVFHLHSEEEQRTFLQQGAWFLLTYVPSLFNQTSTTHKQPMPVLDWDYNTLKLQDGTYELTLTLHQHHARVAVRYDPMIERYDLRYISRAHTTSTPMDYHLHAYVQQSARGGVSYTTGVTQMQAPGKEAEPMRDSFDLCGYEWGQRPLTKTEHQLLVYYVVYYALLHLHGYVHSAPLVSDFQPYVDPEFWGI